MDNIILALNVVFPLLFMMVVGYVIRKINLVDDHSLDVMNTLIFRVFMAILIFLNIYSMKVKEAINNNNLRLIIMSYIIVIAIFLFCNFILPKFIGDKKKCSVIIQGIVRSNSILFGIPIAASIYGENHIGVVSLLSACLILLFNVLGVTVLEVYRGGKVKLKKIISGIVKNPCIISSALAMLFLISGIKISKLILFPLESMSKITTPLAFIVLGGTFNFKMLNKNLKYLTTVTIGKLILLPAIAFLIAYQLGFQDEAMVALLGVMASPAPVASFTMAKEMDADGELAGQIVISTSIISILTIFVWVYLLKTLNLI